MLWTYINVRDLLELCLDNIEILDGHVDMLVTHDSQGESQGCQQSYP